MEISTPSTPWVTLSEELSAILVEFLVVVGTNVALAVVVVPLIVAASVVVGVTVMVEIPIAFCTSNVLYPVFIELK
jgi:hypothetical protein